MYHGNTIRLYADGIADSVVRGLAPDEVTADRLATP